MEVFKRFSEMTPEEAAEHDARIKARRADDERRADALRAQEVRKQRAATMVPRAFIDLIDGDGFHSTEALGEVRADDFDVLVLGGSVGRGKSVAASWWLLEAVGKSKHEPLFVSSARLSRWERYDNAEMDRLLLAIRLVIDDLGEEFNDTKGNFLAVLDETISDRIANRRKTVITTNLDVVKFRDRYGERITDRIKGAGRWVAFAGKSMRGTQIGLLPAPGAPHP